MPVTFDLQAFGVGALEDDDDEDVYHRDSMSRYDTVLGGEEPGDGLYGWTAPQQYTKKRGGRKKTRRRKYTFIHSFINSDSDSFSASSTFTMCFSVFPSLGLLFDV